MSLKNTFRYTAGQGLKLNRDHLHFLLWSQGVRLVTTWQYFGITICKISSAILTYDWTGANVAIFWYNNTFWFWFVNQQDSLTNMFADADDGLHGIMKLYIDKPSI